MSIPPCAFSGRAFCMVDFNSLRSRSSTGGSPCFDKSRHRQAPTLGLFLFDFHTIHASKMPEAFASLD